MVTAAFFDVDNTLVKGSSLFLIGRGLIGRGLVRRQDVALRRGAGGVPGAG